MDEQTTRKNLIDKQLKKAGWLKEYIKEEVNSVKSNFKNKDYVLKGPSIEKGVDRFIDYLLLAEDFTPLAIIEVKKPSKEPDTGTIQSRTYVKDIEKQLNYRLPMFLTNGIKWIYKDQDEIERIVSGVFSQEDLKRRKELYNNQKDPSKIPVNPRIMGDKRPKNILFVKQLAEHFSKGYGKALVQMATGTGKTRLAMALIDILKKANYVRNVLFIADRIILANQASSDGFKEFFRGEPTVELHIKGFSTTARLYTSTIQTLMGKKGKTMFEKFSPGFFDLIIFDEAHRSIYDKNNYVNMYFDAIKVGLTATPRQHESKNTYDLFGCKRGEPTIEYSYDDAVNDGILVPYKGKIIETERLELGIKGQKLSEDLKDQLRKQEIDPESFEIEGSKYEKVFVDRRINEIIVAEFVNRCYRSDENLPAKTIFFCVGKNHAKAIKKIFGELFPKLSKEVQVITSDEYRAQDEIRRFKLNSEPRIALSVGMLDTGVDIPEVCNLVFARPVFSSIRFWQMMGRGTRNLDACKHPEWLQHREKNDFLVLDFVIGGHSNIKVHKIKQSKDKDSGKNVMVSIFENRVNLLKEKLSNEQKKIIVDKLIWDIKSLDKDSFVIRDKLPLLTKIGKTFDLEKYVRGLLSDIAPLMILNQGDNANITSFILQTEKLFKHIIKSEQHKIEKIKNYVWEMLNNILLKDSLSEIQNKKKDILKVLQESYWDDLTFEKVEFLIKEIAPLMKYYEPLPKKMVRVDAPDMIIREEEVDYEIQHDSKFEEFVKNNPILQKIKSGGSITSKEIVHLEKQLTALNPAYSIENIQNQLNKDFLVFIYQIIGLTHEYDPQEIIEREFHKHIMDPKYNYEQIEFLLLLKKFFSNHKKIELADFAKSPLSDERPLDKFEESELKVIVEKCNEIRMR